MAVFADEEHARANSAKPETGEWARRVTELCEDGIGYEDWDVVLEQRNIRHRA